MVRNHQCQEQAVEIGALRGGKLRHLFRRRHARHLVRGMHCVMGGRLGHVFATLAQPLLHKLDFVCLRRIDATGYVDQLRTVRPVGHQRRHLDRLVVMRDHVLHETSVGRRVARVGDLDRFVSAEFARRLARRARLYDRRVGRSERQCQHYRGQQGEASRSSPPKSAYGQGKGSSRMAISISRDDGRLQKSTRLAARRKQLACGGNCGRRFY